MVAPASAARWYDVLVVHELLTMTRTQHILLGGTECEVITGGSLREEDQRVY
jgi:hypothetical protein